jgi:CDP-4-dehydro-6-deoxyglucose reductase
MPRSVSVYWGGRIEADLYFDLKSLLGAHKFVPVLSRADLNWSGARGYVQNFFLSERPDIGKTVVYSCGSDVMINDARRVLLAAGLPAGNFHSDAFVCSS